jgi:hypothetical protein
MYGSAVEMMEWVVFAVISGSLLWWMFRENAKEADEKTRQYNIAVERHVENLLKGGLIPKAPRMIHEEALRRLGERHPGIKLPKARYYEPREGVPL